MRCNFEVKSSEDLLRDAAIVGRVAHDNIVISLFNGRFIEQFGSVAIRNNSEFY